MSKKETILPENKSETRLYSDICSLIESTRLRVATTANTEIIMLHWQIGVCMKEDILRNQRADYGKQIVKHLSKRLTERYGRGWSDRQLFHCIRAAYTFSEEQIVYAVRTQLTWTHLRSIMFIDDQLKRDFYIEMCRLERWDTRTLDEKIDSQLFELTALSKKPEEVIKQELAEIRETNSLTPDVVFRSGYFLDMLGLSDVYSERDLEDAILIQLQAFIKELGNDFAFLDRQKRITVDAIDYRIDLLFYHRGLRRLVAIDLKLGKFKPEHEGQMLLYLRYLNKNERKVGEESPIGLILCSEGNTEHIEYLMLEDSNIKIAQYFTQLPDKKVLSEKLKRAIAIGREHYKEKFKNN